MNLNRCVKIFNFKITKFNKFCYFKRKWKAFPHYKINK